MKLTPQRRSRSFAELISVARNSIPGEQHADHRSQSQSDAEGDAGRGERMLFGLVFGVIEGIFCGAAAPLNGAVRCFVVIGAVTDDLLLQLFLFVAQFSYCLFLERFCPDLAFPFDGGFPIPSSRTTAGNTTPAPHAITLIPAPPAQISTCLARGIPTGS